DVVQGHEGDWLRIEVRDDGEGMPREVMERGFEPFFTTKEVGKGSGLGLSQVYGFVRQSGGCVAVDSEVGEGTGFRLYLPPSEATPQLEAPEGSERLLVVEDDPAVLALGVEMLTGLGYEVLTAPDAPTALEVLERDEPIDLLFSDVVMPGGASGVQLARAA